VVVPQISKAPKVLFFIGFIFLFVLSCGQDSDLYDELSMYEEVNKDIEDKDLNSEDEETDENTNEDENSDEESNNLVHPIEGAFYVTANGSASNDGTSENTAWSWPQAVANARAGDIVYVKAGNYSGFQVTFRNSGTSQEPIVFMGYKETPGDIDAEQQQLSNLETRGRRGTTKLANDATFNYKNGPSSEEMPFFQKNYRRDETAMRIDGSHVHLKNFVISGYSTGVFINSSSDSAEIMNCIFHEQGNMNVGMRDTSHPDRYKGTGVWNKGALNADIQFCTFLNVEQNALQFQGANTGVVANNMVYSYNTTNGTDYMFLITRNGNTYSQDLVFEYNKCERMAGVPHGGHGFVIKNGGHSNTIRNFEVVNTSVEMNFANVYENLVEDGNIQGAFYNDGDPLSSVFFGNGAHHNTFRNLTIDNTWGAIACSSYGDGASNDPNINTNYPGNDNKFINIVAKNSQYAFIMSEFGAEGSREAYDTMFINCTFYNVEYGVRANRPNSNIQFYNTTFNTTRGFVIESNGFSLNNNTTFENCHFDGASRTSAVSSYNDRNNIQGNPMFMNANGSGLFDISGFQLQDNSPLEGAGKDISSLTNEASKDSNGKNRVDYNIGAF